MATTFRNDVDAAVERVLELPVTTRSMSVLVDECTELIRMGDKGRPPAHIACVDPHTLMMAQSNPQYREALLQAWRLLPDGVGVTLASRLFGEGRIRARITGPDFFDAFSDRLNGSTRAATSYFFLGTVDETLQKIVTRMRRCFPNIDVAGTFAPPFRRRFEPEDESAMVAAVNDSGADVLWVGMTAPKQEIFTYRNSARLSNVRLIGSIGAAFDYFSGTRRRAPVLMQWLGLESHYRMLQQPLAGGRRIVNSYRFVFHLIARRAAAARVWDSRDV